MTSYQPHRPIAGLPQHHSQQPRPGGAVPGTQPAPRQPLRSIYNPNPAELHAGARNRLFLALRSGVDSEVDWSLPRLILASFDQPDLFKLEAWHESVNALLAYPTQWVGEMEKEAVLFQLRQAGAGDADSGLLGIVSDWTRDADLETRAINSLLVLRNASFTSNNARAICKAPYTDFLVRLFSLPADFLLDLSLRQPEVLQHVFVLIQSTFPYLAQKPPPSIDATATAKPDRKLLDTLSKTMTSIVIETRDAGILHNLMPILIAAYQIPHIPLAPPQPELIPYLLKTLTLAPPPPLLDLSIDLLISLTQNSSNSRSVLSDPRFPAHLRNMVLLLEHSVRKTAAAWEAPGQLHGMVVPNPASGAGLVEQASKRRKVEREHAQKILESGNTVGVLVEVGDRPPPMSAAAKKKLLLMKEPARSIHW